MAKRDRVSDAWLAEHRRKAGRGGVDQSRVRQWPVNKIVNEVGWFNARRLRRRA
jgi:hypothetical protein